MKTELEKQHDRLVQQIIANLNRASVEFYAWRDKWEAENAEFGTGARRNFRRRPRPTSRERRKAGESETGSEQPRIGYARANPLTIRERLTAAREALQECADALYDSLRGWRTA